MPRRVPQETRFSLGRSFRVLRRALQSTIPNEILRGAIIPRPERWTFGLRETANRVLERDIECFREPLEGEDRHVILAAFDGTDVGAMNTGPEGALLLGPAELFPGLPEISSELDERVVLSGHAGSVPVDTVKIDRV